MAGFISVLPGAFSAYRYRALAQKEGDHSPLDVYFQGEKLEGSSVGIWEANMWLAEVSFC
jgi:chitin synthase